MKTVAIYSRKSKFTGKGDSVENQVNICKDYIKKTITEPVEFLVFEDEGFSGGNLDRPEFKRLIASINKIDILICYRLDRISRNVADFSSTLENLQINKCDFISVKEQFDTSSPMGRAMIYIASVFAQLERETIAERVKDNMLEMAKNGHWTGGKIPIGFDSKKTKYVDENGTQRNRPQLIINEHQADFVKFIYNKYLELGSLHKLECYIAENNIRSSNGILFEKSSLKLILQNPIYVKSNSDVIEYLRNNNWNVYGEADGIHSLLTYNKTEQSKKNGKYVKQNKDISERLAAISSIEGFIDADLWLKVQKQFNDNKDTFPRLGKTHNALLTSKLKCGKCKEYMLIQHGRKSTVTGEKLFYYVCSLKRKSHKKLCDNKNSKAASIENLMIMTLKTIPEVKKEFLLKLKQKYNAKNLNNSKIDIKILEKNLSDNKSLIDGLVNKLALIDDNNIIEILMDKISALKKESDEITNKINNIQNELQKEKLEMLNLELVESMLDRCSNIDKLPHDEQKRLIDILVDVIYYYGPDNNNSKSRIDIRFIGDIDLSELNSSAYDKLQNCSSCTC